MTSAHAALSVWNAHNEVKKQSKEQTPLTPIVIECFIKNAL